MITVRMSLESGDASGLLVTERTLMWLFWLKQIRTVTIEGTMQGHNGPTAVSKTRPFSTYLERKMVKTSHVTCKIQSECFILAQCGYMLCQTFYDIGSRFTRANVFGLFSVRTKHVLLICSKSDVHYLLCIIIVVVVERVIFLVIGIKLTSHTGQNRYCRKGQIVQQQCDQKKIAKCL